MQTNQPKRRHGWRWVLLFVLALLTACGADTEEADRMVPAAEPLAELATAAPAPLLPGDEVIGAELYNAADEEVAQINDVLFDGSGVIQFVVLDVSETTEDSPYYAVNWDKLALATQPDAVGGVEHFLYDDPLDWEDALDIDEAVLSNQNVFMEAAGAAGVPEQTLDGLLKLSAFADFELLGYDLINPYSDARLGGIDELLVDVEDATVSYAIADVGNLLPDTDDRAVIPWSFVTFSQEERDFYVNIDEETLQNAPTMTMIQGEAESWLADLTWEPEVRAYWSEVMP